MAVADVELHQDLRSAVGELCRRFPDTCWRELDRNEADPEEFVRTLTEAGYQVAPISTNLILSYIAEHVLGLPRSF